MRYKFLGENMLHDAILSTGSSDVDPTIGAGRSRIQCDKPPTLLLVGCGVLGGYLLDLLSWVGFPGRIIVGCRDVNHARERSNMSWFAGLNLGHSPSLTVVPLDLDDVERTCDTLGTLRPDIIVNTASVQSYWRISQLPVELYRRLNEPGVGPWLPMHLSPALKLMTAVRGSRSSAVVVNTAFPDAVNPALATCGLAPTIGIGNVMNAVPAVRSAVASHRGVDVAKVTVRLAAHHYVSNRLPSAGDAGPAPFLLRVYEDGRDITDQLDLAQALRLIPTELRRVRGREGMYVTASSAYSVINALMSASPIPLHAPGPQGLIGGYPVRVSASGVELDLPEEWTRAQAAEVNRRGQVHDGIAYITDDGRVGFSDHAVSTMSEVLGHDCEEIHVTDSPEWAAELRARYSVLERSCDLTGSPA